MRIKDEDEWVKIPDHHQPLVSKEMFDKVQARLPHTKSIKRNRRIYPLRGKVFCGCCHHAMPRSSNKNHAFICRYTEADKHSPCSGLRIAEAELESALYEVLSKKAQIILNLNNLSNAEQVDIQLAEQAEYDNQVEEHMDKKRVLYERLLLQEISIEEYRTQTASVDRELDRLRELQSALKAQAAQMKSDEKTKSARTKLAREAIGAGGLTAGLADTLIERVYVYPGNLLDIEWKMKDFCTE